MMHAIQERILFFIEVKGAVTSAQAAYWTRPDNIKLVSEEWANWRQYIRYELKIMTEKNMLARERLPYPAQNTFVYTEAPLE